MPTKRSICFRACKYLTILWLLAALAAAGFAVPQNVETLKDQETKTITADGALTGRYAIYSAAGILALLVGVGLIAVSVESFVMTMLIGVFLALFTMGVAGASVVALFMLEGVLWATSLTVAINLVVTILILCFSGLIKAADREEEMSTPVVPFTSDDSGADSDSGVGKSGGRILGGAAGNGGFIQRPMTPEPADGIEEDDFGKRPSSVATVPKSPILSDIVETQAMTENDDREIIFVGHPETPPETPQEAEELPHYSPNPSEALELDNQSISHEHLIGSHAENHASPSNGPSLAPEVAEQENQPPVSNAESQKTVEEELEEEYSRRIKESSDQ